MDTSDLVHYTTKPVFVPRTPYVHGSIEPAVIPRPGYVHYKIERVYTDPNRMFYPVDSRRGGGGGDVCKYYELGGQVHSECCSVVDSGTFGAVVYIECQVSFGEAYLINLTNYGLNPGV